MLFRSLVDFNDQKRGRLTLIRDLLDRLPDREIPPPELELAPLPRKSQAEKYTVVKPLPTFGD